MMRDGRVTIMIGMTPGGRKGVMAMKRLANGEENFISYYVDWARDLKSYSFL
jgi:hypothetical protein